MRLPSLSALALAAFSTLPAWAVTPADYTGPNGNWNLSTNWSTYPAIPLNTLTDTYDVSITGKTVAYNIPGSNAVTSLALTGARLNLLAGDNLSVTGDLAAANSALSAAGALFSVAGNVNANTSNLLVSAGGSMSLPGLTTYATASNQGGTFQADGTGSQLSLANLATISLVQHGASIRAQNGAAVSLPALTSFSGSGSIFEGSTFLATGANSTLRANALPALTMNGASITLQAQTGGFLEMTSLASVANTGSIFGNFNAYADGASAKISLPALTSMALNGSSNTLRATAGGLLEATTLSTLTAAFAGFEQLNLTSNGTGSVVNVGTHITSWKEVTASVQGGGTILWGSPTTVNASTLQIDGSGTLNTASLTNMDSTNLTALNAATLSVPVTAYASTTLMAATWNATGPGSQVLLPNLTTLSAAGNDLTLQAQSGGLVDLPLVNTFTSTGRFLNLQTTGSGSTLNLPQLGSAPLSHVNVSLNGGAIQWGSPTTLKNGSITLTTSGAVNLTSLTNVDSTSLTAAAGATLTLPNLTAYSTLPGTGATLQAVGTGSQLLLPALTTLANPGDVFSGVTVLANGGQVTLDSLSTVTTVAASITFRAQAGGTLQANALTTVSNPAGSIFGSFAAFADDSNSRLLLPHLTTMHLQGADNTLRATAGGDLELPALTTITSTGNIFENFDVQSTGPGSLVNLKSLASTVPFPDSLHLANDGELDLAAAAAPFAAFFSANFASGSTGTLDVYLDHILVASLTPNNFGVFTPYQINFTTTPAPGAAVDFIAHGSGADVTLQDYHLGAIPEPATLALLTTGALALLARRPRTRHPS